MKFGEKFLIAFLLIVTIFVSANATDRLVLVEMFTNAG
jgi:hypothetical protein